MRLVFSMIAISLVPACGCSSSADNRQEMTGTVTYKGLPVPYGQIAFDPDTSKGNKGPQGSGEIRNGEYRTQTGFGAVTGPVKVRITGYDGIVPSGPEAEMYKNGRPLPFGEYTTSMEIKPGETKANFVIPAR